MKSRPENEAAARAKGGGRVVEAERPGTALKVESSPKARALASSAGARDGDGGALLVASWPKNAREHVRVSLGAFNGRRIVDIRAYFDGEDGRPHPTKKGIALDLRHLARLADAIVRARDEAARLGLLPTPADTP